MPIPASYTEATLAAYMHDALGDIALILGFNATSGVGSYQEAVNQALLDYGVSVVTDATDIRAIRALARRAAFEKALVGLSGRYTFRTSDKTFNRKEMYEMLQPRLDQARYDCAEFDLNNVVSIDRVVFKDDPYVYLPDEVRAI